MKEEHPNKRHNAIDQSLSCTYNLARAAGLLDWEASYTRDYNALEKLDHVVLYS